MANEPPPHKGEQVKGDPPIVENAQLPRMGTQALPPKLIHAAVRHLTVGAAPAHGANLMVPVPEDHMPKPIASGKPTSPAQELVGWLRPSLTMATRRSFMAWMVGMLILLSACSSAPTASPSPSPTSNDPCAVQGQTPPSGNIAANFATALAFTPDGRLF